MEENLFKKAQQTGIAFERKEAQEDIKQPTYDTTIAASAWARSQSNKDIDYTQALNGLSRIVAKEQAIQQDEDFVKGTLDAQTGKAIEDNASKWTKRGYESFKQASEVQKIAATTSANMDTFAEMSSQEFKEYLQGSYDTIASTVTDPFMKEQLAKQYTSATQKLTTAHVKAQEEVNREKTVNYARENIVSSLAASKGVVDKTVLNEIAKTKGALPARIAAATIGDAAYTSMIAEGNTGLYVHLEKTGFFNELDSKTRDQLTRTYLSVTKANQQAASDIQNDTFLLNALNDGSINSAEFTKKDRNKAFDIFLKSVNENKKDFPDTEDGRNKQTAAIIEQAVRNNYYSAPAAKYVGNLIENPIRYVDGKPVVDARSVGAYRALAIKTKELGDNRDVAFSKFMDDKALAIFDTLNDSLSGGILGASNEDLYAGLAETTSLLNKSRSEDGKKVLSTSYKEGAYLNGKENLAAKIEQMTGQSVPSAVWGDVRTFLSRDMGQLKPNDIRDIPIQDTSEVEDAYTRLFNTYRMREGKTDEAAAKLAASTIARKTYNILGTAIVYEEKRPNGSVVPLPMLFGLSPSNSAQDVSENLGKMLEKRLEFKGLTKQESKKAIRNNIANLNVKLDPDKDTITISSDVDKRNVWQKIKSDMVPMFISNNELELIDEIANTSIQETFKISDIRNHNIDLTNGYNKVLQTMISDKQFEKVDELNKRIDSFVIRGIANGE